MRFENDLMERALQDGRATKDPKRRSEADNLLFEGRMSPRRRSTFEGEAGLCDDWTALRKAHIDYVNNFVRVDSGGAIPHTFLDALAPAGLGSIDENQEIVRLEELSWPLKLAGLTFEEFSSAFANSNYAVIDKFLADWNITRDLRPAFGAFEDELSNDLTESDWHLRYRDRLGLAHIAPNGTSTPVALMRYTVKEVLAAAPPSACAFTAPTALDCAPWPYFFPAPSELSCGRTMALHEVRDDNELVAEFLHTRLEYRRSHIVKLGVIDMPLVMPSLRVMRNSHLDALHVAAGRDDFGEPIPDECDE